MKHKIRICLAQVNLVVGDVIGNTDRVIASAFEARDEHDADIVVFPELTLTGYPPEDLLLREDFIRTVEREFETLRNTIEGICFLVGYPLKEDGVLYNAAAAIDNGNLLGVYRKQALPNYNVFDEVRYFRPGNQSTVFERSGWNFGITICEDVWEPNPVAAAVDSGAEVVLNLNASPFDLYKSSERENQVVGAMARAHGVPIIYTNLVGGQDELVFDGSSFAVDDQGRVVHRAAAFKEQLSSVELTEFQGKPVLSSDYDDQPQDEDALVYAALVAGVGDYINKNGFKGVVLGLSGGIDSALTLAVAVDALGAQRVEAVTMPSRYTRDMSIQDAHEQCRRLGVTCHEITIEPMFESFLTALDPVLGHYPGDTTEENIQARCRGILLMAISNKTGKIVLTTGNKSEIAVGYATLYGDMAGGFAAIKDVPKTLVYRLAKYRNRQTEVIPVRVIERPPSAELAPDQVDQDSLPEYDVLDAILEAYVEQDQSVDEIVGLGFDRDEVLRVVRMVTRNEYKRRQAPPGVKITRRAFGRDRRYPLTSAYRHS